MALNQYFMKKVFLLAAGLLEASPKKKSGRDPDDLAVRGPFCTILDHTKIPPAGAFAAENAISVDSKGKSVKNALFDDVTTP